MNGKEFHPKRAYRNDDFLTSPNARGVRILSEYLEPLHRFEKMNVEDTILFFGSARIPSRDEAERQVEAAKAGGGDLARAESNLRMSRYYEDTRELSRRLTEWSKDLRHTGARFVVCSGGGPGIMEAANRGASEARGDNIGLGISLPREQAVNLYVTRELAFEFHYFFTRKFWFLYLAKALVIMPGGFGTLDELFEALTLIQTGKMTKKMPIVLYGRDFWEKAVNFRALVEFGTISRSDIDLFTVCDSVDDAFSFITQELEQDSVGMPDLRL